MFTLSLNKASDIKTSLEVFLDIVLDHDLWFYDFLRPEGRGTTFDHLLYRQHEHHLARLDSLSFIILLLKKRQLFFGNVNKLDDIFLELDILWPVTHVLSS